MKLTFNSCFVPVSGPSDFLIKISRQVNLYHYIQKKQCICKHGFPIMQIKFALQHAFKTNLNIQNIQRKRNKSSACKDESAGLMGYITYTV